MYEKEINELVEISHFAGSRPDYTQGGGGNTSVKLDGTLMAIKASGYKLLDITPEDAYVTVDYRAVRDYYENVDTAAAKDFEAESARLAKDAVRLLPGMKALRPSVEVGFHAVLKKYVIHVHSAYVNLLTCNKNGAAPAEKIFRGKSYGHIFVPYINPGFSLTLEIMKGLAAAAERTGTAPEVIFMVNHGLVVHADSAARAMDTVRDVNEEIMKYFSVAPGDFGKVSLQKLAENRYKSDSAAVAGFLSRHDLSRKLLSDYPLYPDQLVYLNNLLANSPEKMEIPADGVFYNTAYKEALTLEETLAAYLFTLDTAWKRGVELSVMNEKEVDFINNWEAEKFRRSVAK